MGEVTAHIELENTHDTFKADEGIISREQVRRHVMTAVVDTGAVMMMLPQDVIEALGLREVRKTIVVLANEQKIEMSVHGPVTVRVGNRSANVDCLKGPPASEALFGQIPLEYMDLLVDPTTRTLLTRPESPFLPILKLKMIH